MPRQRSWSARFEERTRKSPVLVVLFFAATTLSSLTIILAGLVTAVTFVGERTDWRDQSYNELRGLRAGFGRETFREELGVPVFDRRSSDGRYREESYRRREHWVQVISDRAGTVVLYAVTSCNDQFRPTFPVPGLYTGLDGSYLGRVALRNSTFEDVQASKFAGGLEAEFFQGVTANSRFLEIYAGGNPADYKTFVWGITDGCEDWQQESERLYFGPRRALCPTRNARLSGPISDVPRWLRRSRDTARVNTYAETSPLFKLRSLQGEFQVGVDRLLTRTAIDYEKAIKARKQRESPTLRP